MIEILIILGWAFAIWVIGAIILLACLFIPSFFVKINDPSGGLLSGFISMAVLLVCVAWPIIIPILIYQHFTKEKKID